MFILFRLWCTKKTKIFELIVHGNQNFGLSLDILRKTCYNNVVICNQLVTFKPVGYNSRINRDKTE